VENGKGQEAKSGINHRNRLARTRPLKAGVRGFRPVGPADVSLAADRALKIEIIHTLRLCR